MKWISLIIYSSIIFASEPDLVIRNQSNDLVLTNQTCAEIEKNIKDLKAWVNRSESRTCEADITKRDNKCEAVISKCVPGHVLKYHNSNPELTGPNCWNLALVMAKIIPHLRYVDEKEMSFFMGPPLCQKLEKNQKPQSGDIGAVRTKENSEVHGFIYVSENLVYSKNGSNFSDSYALQSKQKVFDKYHVGENQVEYFHCQSMNEFLSSQQKTDDKFYAAEFNRIKKLECLLQNANFDASVLANSNVQDLALGTVSSLQFYLDQYLKKNDLTKLSEREKFLLGSIKMRILSIEQQIKFNKQTMYAKSNREKMSIMQDMINEDQAKLASFIK